jgi:hypothetical protein
VNKLDLCYLQMSDAVEDTYSVKSMTRTRVVLPIFVVNQINYLQFINL